MSKSSHVVVHLSTEQRTSLETLIQSGSAPARTQTRARILLLSDRSQGLRRTEEQIAEALLCNKNTVGNVRRRYAAEGVDAALYDKARPGAKPKITGDIEAKITLLACSTPPEGHARWTLRLLADRAVELGYVESVSHVAIGETLKKTSSSPGVYKPGALANRARST